MKRALDLVAEVERRLISERTRLALQAKRARGEVTNHAPLGSIVAADGKRLEPDGAEVAALARARILRDRGEPWRAIAADLERTHPRPDGRRWHARSIDRVLGRAA